MSPVNISTCPSESIRVHAGSAWETESSLLYVMLSLYIREILPSFLFTRWVQALPFTGVQHAISVHSLSNGNNMNIALLPTLQTAVERSCQSLIFDLFWTLFLKCPYGLQPTVEHIPQSMQGYGRLSISLSVWHDCSVALGDWATDHNKWLCVQ